MVKAAAAFKPTNSGSFKRHIGLLIEAGFKRTEINEALTAAGSSEISGRQFTEAGAAGKAGSIGISSSDMKVTGAKIRTTKETVDYVTKKIKQMCVNESHGANSQLLTSGEIVDLPKLQRMFTPSEMADKIAKGKPPNMKISRTTLEKMIKQVTCGNPRILQGLDTINQEYGQGTVTRFMIATQYANELGVNLLKASLDARIQAAHSFLKREYLDLLLPVESMALNCADVRSSRSSGSSSCNNNSKYW